MKTAKRIITACLTTAMALQALAPTTQALAWELNAVSSLSVGTQNAAEDGVSYLSAEDLVSTDGGAADGATDAVTGDGDLNQSADSSGDSSSDENGDPISDDSSSETGDTASDSANADASEAGSNVADAAADTQNASDADVAVTADEPYAFAKLEDLKAAIGEHGSVSGDTITFNDNDALILISNTDPSAYKNATITKGGSTGTEFDVTGKASYNGIEYSFRGLGDDSSPFAGTFNASGSSIAVNASFYNDLSLSDGNNSISLTWKGTSNDPVVAKKVTGNDEQLDANITLVDSGASNPQESDPAITSALLGEATGDLFLNVSYVFTGTRKGIDIAAENDNAGLLVNTLKNSASLTIASVTGLDKADDNQSISATNGNAGGLIGLANNGSKVTVNTSVDVSKLNVTATAANGNDKTRGAAGGFIGYATNFSLVFGNDATVHPALKVGNADGSYAGGAIGCVSFKENFTVISSMFSFGENGDSVVELGTKRRAGGLFGSLDLTNGDVTIQGGAYRSKLAAKNDDINNRGAYGGIAGNVCSTNDANGTHALIIEKKDGERTRVEIQKAADLFYTGGVAGYLGGDGWDGNKKKVAIVLDGVQVTCSGDASVHAGNAKYGGAVGVVDTNQVLDARDFKLVTSGDTKLGSRAYGGVAGVAGSAWRGIIKFSGVTDLSEAEFNENNNTAQLVHQNYNSLFFATGSGSGNGWQYLRPKNAVKIDDIYDYGQVIRLGENLDKDLIKVDENTHVLELGTKLPKTGDSYVLNTADDFAKLAITWQTFGYFSMADGVENTGKGYKNLLNSRIEIANNIDLSTTGLTGLSKDRVPDSSGDEYKQEGGGDGVYEKDCAFSGTLTGSGSINLAVGEPYGMRNGSALGLDDVSDGNGKIYRHGRLGLFNQLGGATINGSVTIGGTMKFDAKNDIDAGALAAVRTGDNTSISGLTVTTAITYDNTDENKTENIGGIFGQVDGSGQIDFKSNVSAKPTITSRVQDKGYVRAAAAIGYITKESSVTVNATDITVGGSITISNYAKDTLAGGFIAYIRQDEATVTAGETKTINIKGLSFDGFNMNVNAQNSNNKNAGGLLGYSWGNAIVDFAGAANKYSLSTSNAAIATNNATGFGGLVYAASGYWKINDYAIDLGGVKLSAPDAGTFGMLVCRAGSSRNSADKVGVDALTGLYLKNTAPWKTAYRVNSSDDAISTSAKTFDEWIADTTRSGSKIDDIVANGVISLHTEDETLDMSGDAAKRNSYENRTNYGKSHQTNSSARYYYNLDRAVEDAGYNDLWISNAEGLLLWSAWMYAPSGIRDYIKEGLDSNNKTIDGTLRVDGDIDLTGYSYYPVDNNGATAHVRGSLTFCYREIAKTEESNKKNNALSQHSNMHLSLFRNFYPSAKSNTLNVGSVDKPLSLKGTIGKDVLNGRTGSGALISNSLQGDSSAGKIAAVSVNDKGVILDGLTVWTEDGDLEKGGSSPLLINAMPKYSSLTVKNLSVKEGSYSAGTKAATSLFGTLGGADADMVSASFSNISVPSLTNDTIFIHASLLESFGYKQGATASANYIFYKKDPVTYGREIDASGSNNEYVGKQLWYYDEATYGYDAGLVEDQSGHKASAENPQFGGYLPYVYKGKNGTTYHEIKVNQRVPSLITGCGTYGDPYVISSASQIYTVSSYINNETTAVDDWEVTIVKDQETLCNRRSGSTDNEITYVYKGGAWTEKNGTDTISNDTIHRYLQSAYFSVEPADPEGSQVDSIELDTSEFSGFGNKSNPFRGVIVGGLKKRDGASVSTGLVIKNDDGKTTQGLIPYSYGSVIKDLTVTYSGSKDTITYAAKDSADGVPNSFFGGIIGCIMGGDNIIDDVTVSADGEFSVTRGGDKPHLVAVGGYVGTIAGGGVIFRNMTSDSWLKDDVNTRAAGVLYTNPYVGRVIDGFAFSEGCAVDNGDKNYQVNQLTGKGIECVVTSGSNRKYKGETDSAITTEVKNAQGLLVLSAIISSGAGGGSSYSDWTSEKEGQKYGESGYEAGKDYGSFNGSRAYAGRTTGATGNYLFGNDSLGKVRNASYSYVGKPAEATEDFNVSNKDDRLAPGNQSNAAALDQSSADNVNSPYLVKSYATWETGNVCAPKASGMDLQFDEGTYDMSKYGTGFTGLSGRYYSNACASNYGADRDRIVPQIACINGNSAKIVLKSDVKQYLDDDYFLQSWGGLFSAVEFTNTSVSKSLEANEGYLVKDLQLGDDVAGATRSSVSLNCLKADGALASYADLKAADAVDKDWQNSMPHMGVGAFAGTTANRDELSGKDEGKYKGVKVTNCDVTSMSMAGGLFGNSGWAKRRTDLDRSRLISFDTQTSPVRLYNSSYSNITVTGATRVGGFIGAVGGNGSIAGAWALNEESTLGADSTITSTEDSSIVGGAFGLCWSTIRVNVTDDGSVSDDYKNLKFNNVTVQNKGKISSPNSVFEGTGGLIGDPKVGCDVARLTIGSDKSASGADATCIQSTQNNELARRVGGVVGQIDVSGKNYSFTDVAVQNIKLSAHDSCGGIVGHIMNNAGIVCDGVSIEDVYVDGTYSGGIAGAIASENTTISVSNLSISRTQFTSANNGGISGDGRGKFLLTNVLLDQNAFYRAASKSQGLLLGDLAINQFNGIFASGIDIIPARKTDSDENAVLPKLICASDSNINAANQKSYVAFSDYSDTLNKVVGSSLYNDDSTADVESTSPYVTTNPVNDSVKVKADDTSASKSIFGDGANVDVAATIQAQAGKKDVAGRYTYNNIGGRADDGAYQNSNEYNATTAQSTFNDNNTKAESAKATNNFQVLLIPGNDSATVTNYLNLVTNGGFSDAVRLNGTTQQFVTAKAESFKLSEDKSTFVRSNDDPSLAVVNNGKSNMTFRASTSWDNEESRFTLLTVTFDNGSGHKYKVQVPVIVKRMLELDFTATYTYGTNYKDANFANLGSNAHVLTSVGDAMTGLLTWTYNSSQGKQTEYGWQSHLDSGGKMGSLNKAIEFNGEGSKGTLPSGTQLTLVDVANGDKEYTYTVGEGGAASVKLSDFTDASGNHNHYQEKWLSEVMGVKATAQQGGQWKKMTEGEDIAAAVAKVNGVYYRLPKDGETGDTTLTIDENAAGMPSENFYLVVRVPSGFPASVNGYTATSFTSDVNTNVTYLLRPKNGDAAQVDGHQNTASTYSIAASYGQELTDNRKGTSGDQVERMTLNPTVYDQLKMDVTDTITLGNNEYNDNDSLYYQLDSSLAQYVNNNLTGATGYPSGTSATVNFYVKVGGNYYAWENGAWVNRGATEAPAVAAQNWSATGDDMSLVLKDASGNPVDLSGIRTAAKNASQQSFDITMKADLTMTGPAGEAAIQASTDGTAAFTKPTYRSFLSAHADTLSTSSMNAYNEGGVRYYRPDSGSSTIALMASVKTQLGINVNDLNDRADGTIALAGVYDFSKLNGAEEKLNKGNRVTYTLSLQKRNDDGTYGSVSDIANYVSVLESDYLGKGTPSSDGSSYVFTDTKDANGKFSTRDGDTLVFRHRFTVKVNTNVEGKNQTYANYRLVLTASLDGNGVSDTPVNFYGIADYTNSDYVTYTLTKIKTEGLQHN